MGFIAIFGVVVQIGVLLISYLNRMPKDGLPGRETVIQGSQLLLRPVMMIALTAILGPLPATLANPIGSQAQKLLALVVVGGMKTVQTTDAS